MDSSFALERLEIRSPAVSSDSNLRGHGQQRAVQDGRPQARPNGCVPLSHQVAGHKYGIDKVGILQHPDGTVLKQLQPPPRGPREMNFYTQVYAEDCTDPQLLELQQHLPTFYGTWSSPDAPNDLYLKLEDVTRKFSRPCIMDVKIGRKSYDPFASREKRDQQIRKYPLMEEIGFLLLGMRVYQVNSDSYITHDQHYGRSLLKDTLKDGMARFFHDGEQLRRDAISLSVRRVRSILRWFEGQGQLHFYASSLLFVYEGSSRAGHPTEARTAPKRGRDREGELEYNNNIHPPGSCRFAPQRSACDRVHCGDLPRDIHRVGRENGAWTCPRHLSREQPNGNGVSVPGEGGEERRTAGDCNGGQGRGEGEVEVRMIDFAHVFPSESPDEGYVYGLRNLLSTLEQMLQD